MEITRTVSRIAYGGASLIRHSALVFDLLTKKDWYLVKDLLRFRIDNPKHNGRVHFIQLIPQLHRSRQFFFANLKQRLPFFRRLWIIGFKAPSLALVHKLILGAVLVPSQFNIERKEAKATKTVVT